MIRVFYLHQIQILGTINLLILEHGSSNMDHISTNNEHEKT